ncbi:hypothetical protein Pla52o_01600 [Novipirellula galeiformis]|uniref:Uncharacterized protein n=1 Tax=Novipirellula galeiformis TaxID=2528004 RepID=A0A5C6CRZ5_9BACT|nr:hypothetical protein [Novipirellula galeiformis]TWU26307.1 hypothetical protein Pla52o_01600 [Novipirellula galeiformis]
MTSAVRFVGVMLFVVAVIGCGGGRETGQVVQPPPPDAKFTLEKVADTGNLSAHKTQLHDELQGLGESDPEMSQELLGEYEQLTSLSDTAAIQAKAREMADKL